MMLTRHCISTWPKLTWVARARMGHQGVHVFHGPMVETRDDWIAEAVWDGDFAAGDFDRTDLVFGTGIRCREGHVVFVSSGSTLDRLAYCRCDGVWYVSNSLPAMLAMSGLTLYDDHPYALDLKSICKGLGEYTRLFPADSGEFCLVYFDNLVYDGRHLAEQAKPDAFPDCATFSEYHDFLLKTARALGANAACPERDHPISQLSSISSGYDSIAATIIARQAGCDQTVTIKQATSLWRGSDSGEDVATQLGLACRTVNRTATTYPHEASIWAVAGRPGVLNWSLMEYTEPLCLFFTGNHGDKVWDPSTAELPDPFIIPSVADLGIGEYRLIQGVFHCPVPFWGMRHVRDIRQLGHLDEMAPWTLHTSYDRPIPRRIIEEAGIRRGTFAVRKKNTSHESKFLWPYSPEARDSFARFLELRGLYAPPAWIVNLIRRTSHLDQLFQKNITEKLGMRNGRRPWDRLAGPSLLFQWANSELSNTYGRCVRAVDMDSQAPARSSSERVNIPHKKNVRGDWPANDLAAKDIY